jgi:hypothetical protein
MLVVDLTTVKEHLSEPFILEFRRETRQKVYWNGESRFDLGSLFLTLRQKFLDVAGLIHLAGAAG